MKAYHFFILLLLFYKCYPTEEEIFIDPPGKINRIVTTSHDDQSSSTNYTTTKYYYNSDEQLVRTLTEYYNGEIARETSYEYFQNGSLKRKEVQDNARPAVNLIYHYEYDDQGFLEKEIQEYEGTKFYFYTDDKKLWNMKYYPIEGTGLYDILYEYDSIDGKLKYETKYVQESWDGSKQRINYKYEYNYNTDKLLKNRTLIGGNQFLPIPRIEVEYFYDQGRLKSELHYIVDWKLVYRLDKTIEYFYN